MIKYFLLSYLVMKNLLFLVFTLVVSVAPIHAQEEPAARDLSSQAASALIIFDASGSMWGQIKGRAKIEIAREVVANLVKSLPAETELGLMAYGHRRKGDCDDIELLIPVGKVDRDAFVKTVNNIMPVGMTPITASLERAAELLKYREQKATVILVSDGLETCDADPCEAAKKLQELGLDFTAHVIAFDLNPEEGEQLRCIAESTGGQFFPASDAASLKDALDQAVEAMAPEDKAPLVPDVERTATLTAPDTAVAGSDVQVSWDVEQQKGDYITIAKAGAKDSERMGYAYTKGKTSTAVTTLLEPAMAELRYVSGSDGKVIARWPIELSQFEISLSAADEVVAGANVLVDWTGPNYAGDFITIVSEDTKDGRYERWEYTKNGSPLTIGAPITVGSAEIRYMSGNGSKVLARVAIQVLKGEITLESPAEAVIGSKVEVTWTGPDNERDFITIVPKDTPDGKYAQYAYTKLGSPMKIKAPIEVGEAEIRYMSGNGSKVLARVPLTVIEAKFSLESVPQAVAGSEVSVEWIGPDNESDFITIVPKDTPDGKYAHYSYTKVGSPMMIAAPYDVGEAEIRYMSGQGSKVMARAPLTVVGAEITLKAAAQAIAGEKISVEWTGPNNKSDFITIVPKSTPDGKYESHAYTKAGSPVEIAAPKAAGEAEIRYMGGRGSPVLARIPVLIIEPEKSE